MGAIERHRITKTEVLGYTLVIYEPVAEQAMGPNPELVAAAHAAIRPLKEGLIRLTPEAIVTALRATRASAVQITGPDGNGTMALW